MELAVALCTVEPVKALRRVGYDGDVAEAAALGIDGSVGVGRTVICYPIRRIRSVHRCRGVELLLRGALAFRGLKGRHLLKEGEPAVAAGEIRRSHGVAAGDGRNVKREAEHKVLDAEGVAEFELGVLVGNDLE